MNAGTAPSTIGPNAVPPRAIFCIFIGIYILLSFYAMTTFMLLGSSLGGDWVGHGYQPVANHMLVYGIAQIVDWLVPGSLRPALTSALIGLRDSDLVTDYLQLRYPYPPEEAALRPGQILSTFIRMLVVYTTLWLMVWMYYRLAKTLLGHYSYALAAPALLLLVVAVCNTRAAYTYDYAEIFFSSATLYLLYLRRWRLYLVCFALSCFVKETTLFVLFFYMLYFYRRLPPKEYWGLAALQALQFLAIATMIRMHNAGMPKVYGGYNYMFTGNGNLHLLLNYANYIDLLAFLAIIMLLTCRWHEKPFFLRMGLWMFIPNFIAYFLTCRPGEYRDWFWTLPVMALLAAHTMVSVAGFDRKSDSSDPVTPAPPLSG